MIDETLYSWMLLAGRLCLALVFLVSGVHKSLWFSKAVQEFKDAKVPLLHVFLIGTIILHLVAPVCIILGVFVTESALALVLFTVVATCKVHHFWFMSGFDRLLHSRIALTNLAVVGGLLILAAVGPGNLVIGI